MKQYHDLLRKILSDGTYKEPARENMPTTISLFGYQMDEFDLSKGFPILTTKEVNFKNIVTELLWFLRGDTNVSYLNQNGFKLWNEDSYKYYQKMVSPPHMTYKEYMEKINQSGISKLMDHDNFYNYGDCGYQYGKVWRDFYGTDQISRVIQNLKDNPESRRHVITAVDPSNDDNLALYWCHSLFQFNARPMSVNERVLYGRDIISPSPWIVFNINEITHKDLDDLGVPKYFLDCKMYQRSADVFLGVPYNISSYALLTHFIAKIVKMVPGKYIHTFGDVHIYDNHIDQVNEILARDTEKYPLPELTFTPRLGNLMDFFRTAEFKSDKIYDFDWFIDQVYVTDIYLDGYESFSPIKAPLSTGIKK